MKIDRELLYVMTSSGIGEGEPDLGTKLVEGFFKVLAQAGSPPAKIIFLNSGIFLTTEGSPVEDHLKELERRGTEIVSCTTCLNYFQRLQKLLVGKSGDMRDTVSSLTTYRKVLTF
jgi:selenium metabolism protein YedF